MSVTVKEFLGRALTLPEDRAYLPGEGLWVRQTEDGTLQVGITEPALLLMGGVRQVDCLVEDGATVAAGDTVCLALTGKLKYLATPAGGRFAFANPGTTLNDDPYGVPLFTLAGSDTALSALADAAAYAEALRASEGARNPGGHKGGVSSICKALYWGIGQQELED